LTRLRDGAPQLDQKQLTRKWAICPFVSFRPSIVSEGWSEANKARGAQTANKREQKMGIRAEALDLAEVQVA